MTPLCRPVSFAAVIILAICVYAFLLWNGVFSGTVENEPIPWYFLAKGIFCSLALYLWVSVLGSSVGGGRRYRGAPHCAKRTDPKIFENIPH